MKQKTKAASFGVTTQPATYQRLLAGVDILANAIRPTLGPYPRLVAVSDSFSSSAPTLMDDGGLIARRLIQIADRDADMGAMYLRQLLWRVREDCGDGTATAAVLFQEIVHQGVRHIVSAEGHAMPLRAGLEKGARIVYDELGKMARPLTGRADLARIAESICYDADMARVLAEIFETIGEYGDFEMRSGQRRELDFEYVEGTYWEGALHSKSMINVIGENKAYLENAAVLVTDLMIDDVRQLAAVLTVAKKAGKTALMLVCTSISEAAVGFLNMESTRRVLPVFAVKTPGGRAEEQIAVMEDIAALTGGVPVVREAGETLETVSERHFGEARQVYSKDQFFGIVGGKGDPRQIRAHFERLKSLHASLDSGDERNLVRKRIGKLMGGSATLHVGGATQTEIQARKDLAERAAEAIRGAMLKGVLPGGGAAFLACRPALQAALKQAQDPDEIAAMRILIRAMEAPLRAIAANAGLLPDEVMAELKMAGPGCAYDVRKRQVVAFGGPDDPAALLDSASAVQSAGYRAIAGAALLLTVDVLVRHKKPEQMINP